MARALQGLIERWIRPEIRALTSYHVPPAGQYIKLDAMENPYAWPEAMVNAWLERLRSVALNRYPDPQARPLQVQLRQAMQIPEDMAILLGNGSDELIQMLAQTLAGPGHAILAPEPSFVMYRLIAAVTGQRYIGVPLKDDFSLDLAAMLAAIAEHEPSLVFLSYPNNPTGNLFDSAAVRQIIEAAPGLVVLDEAYAAFAAHSFMSALADYSNLLVLRTVSKMGLAGLRLGLLVGPAAWLNEIDKTRLPYNINVLTQASAEFALQHLSVLDEQTARIREQRELLFKALSALAALTVYPSQANFILFRTPAGRAQALFNGLKERGVLIKNLHPVGGALTDCLRVTVGAAEENAIFLAALRELLG